MSRLVLTSTSTTRCMTTSKTLGVAMIQVLSLSPAAPLRRRSVQPSISPVSGNLVLLTLHSACLGWHKLTHRQILHRHASVGSLAGLRLWILPAQRYTSVSPMFIFLFGIPMTRNCL